MRHPGSVVFIVLLGVFLGMRAYKKHFLIYLIWKLCFVLMMRKSRCKSFFGSVSIGISSLTDQ
jgi:hypothetical protein